ncbi:hypothetical protein SELMODRAFT_236650 [Selaginella moellendorffii]|uniref:Uncharacterized protein AIR3L3-2 n=1 Tax=Selaginella moellendorffii TaxID=88036 RepID=D8TBM4_SELML|nr:hypothetical protein SELMODRAFT_236650 [Selaginella moellendorffii]
MGHRIHDDPQVTCDHNHQVLSSVFQNGYDQAKESMVYSYKHGFRGFSARLSQEQAFDLSKKDGVVVVFPSMPRQLHTTHSWEFLGLQQSQGLNPTHEARSLPHSSKQQSNVIVGVLDTGIWPESSSFSDSLMPPVPSRWKGECEAGELFNASHCNRKLVGARYYLRGLASEMGGPLASAKDGGLDYISPRDASGHGTHTASTVAGRYVTDASFFGLGKGSAVGGAPRARLAVYKVCWSSGCFDADILAAFDDAIKDGVDVMTLSLGPDPPQTDFFKDAISIGSFHALQKGIVVTCSAGNNGDTNTGSATNIAPWIITVAASSMDREFVSEVVLGNKTVFKGASLATSRMGGSFAPLILASSANRKNSTKAQARDCASGSLDPSKVKNSIVVCMHPQDSLDTKVGKSDLVLSAGGKGMILIDQADSGLAVPFALPATLLGPKDGAAILSYINSTKTPVARINPTATVLGSRPAPQIASFSSRGPNSVTPDVLKPDIAAPGLNILAAWSPGSKRMPGKFNIISGTSMACPHVAGVVALLKAAHPSWSPAALKSAIMTTALTEDNTRSPILTLPHGKVANAFDYGSGHVNPRRAANPGLVYDAGPGEFMAYLCSSGYDTKLLQKVTGDKSICPSSQSARRPISNLNYPAIVVSRLGGGVAATAASVTYVGASPARKNSDYSASTAVTTPTVFKASVVAPPGIRVRVVPDELRFSSYMERRAFNVELTSVDHTNGRFVFGWLTWSNGRQRVRSPLAVKT